MMYREVVIPMVLDSVYVLLAMFVLGAVLMKWVLR